jgi:hypothetical protein
MDELGFAKPPRASNLKGRDLAVSGKPIDRPLGHLEELSDFTDGQNFFGHQSTPYDSRVKYSTIFKCASTKLRRAAIAPLGRIAEAAIETVPASWRVI